MRAAGNSVVILGLALYVLSVVMWLMVLAKLDVSFAYPFVSFGFVFIALYAFFILHENMSAGRIGGISLIFLGVLLVARS